MAELNQSGSRSEPIPIDPDLGPISPEPQELDIEPIPLPAEPEDEPEETLSLVEEVETGPSKIHAMQGSALGAEKHQFVRPLNLSGKGATRCRIFHSRISIAPLEHMQKMINEWIDGEGIEVKHVSSVIGTMEGKSPEPNVVLVIWY